MPSRPQRRQVVGYVTPDLKARIEEYKRVNPRTSESMVVEDALIMARAQLDLKYLGQGSGPTHDKPRRKTKHAA